MRTRPLAAFSMLAPSHARHLAVLDWSFAVLSTLRLLTYLPTMWAIYHQGDSSQHSLLTWVVWMGANAAMGASLYERSGHKLNKLILVNAANALQCLATAVLVAWYR